MSDAMTNVNTDDLYQKVDDALPAILPPITRIEAGKAIRAIMRAFGGTQHGSPNMRGRVRWNGRARVCWAATKETRGHDKGWGRLIHDASHVIYEARHPGQRTHGPAHAALEREIAQWVVYRGMLKRPEARTAPSTEEKRRARLANIEARMARWETKLKRAQNALRKLRARHRATERAIHKRS